MRKNKLKEEIYYFKYLDHGTTKGTINEVRQKPFVLWCVGMIANKDKDDPFYAIISDGAVDRERKPSHIEIIIKDAIISMTQLVTKNN